MAMWNIFQLIGWSVLIAVVLVAIVWLMPVVIESINAGYVGEAKNLHLQVLELSN